MLLFFLCLIYFPGRTKPLKMFQRLRKPSLNSSKLVSELRLTHARLLEAHGATVVLFHRCESELGGGGLE